MDKVVSILKVKANNHLILHPLGSFTGYGGYVGTHPYRELPEDCDAETLGATIAELLLLSGPTGYSIKDIEQFRHDTMDAESQRIRTEYLSKIRSTKDTVQQFIPMEVSITGQGKSWRITKFGYDPDQRSLIPNETLKIRISDGVQQLGGSLLALFSTE
jgi:hypothetical protein